MHGASHISSGPPYSHPPTPHYQPYAPQQSMPPASGQYGPGSTYPSYGGYPPSVTSPQSAGPHMQPNLPLPGMYARSKMGKRTKLTKMSSNDA